MRMWGWPAVSAPMYAEAYARWGGSVITHPQVLDFLHHHVVGLKSGYHAHYSGSQLQGVVCRWGRVLAGDFQTLKRQVRPAFDLGEPEIILPMAADARPACLWLRADTVSEVNQPVLRNLLPVRKTKNHVALAKDHGPQGMSSKAKYSRRREWKAFQAAGGVARSVHEFSPRTLAELFCHLFQRRRGIPWPGAAGLETFLDELSGLCFGSVLFMRDTPCAYQLVLRTRSPRWWAYEYINSGVDPDFNEWSPGSVLLWLNTHQAWEETQGHTVAMRYSFGRNRGAYKQAWCTPHPVYRTLSW